MLSYIWFWKINSKGVVFNMEPFKNFKVAAYVYAYYLEKVDEAEIQRGIDYFKKYIHLDKEYIENHRGPAGGRRRHRFPPRFPLCG